MILEPSPRERKNDSRKRQAVITKVMPSSRFQPTGKEAERQKTGNKAANHTDDSGKEKGCQVNGLGGGQIVSKQPMEFVADDKRGEDDRQGKAKFFGPALIDPEQHRGGNGRA